MPVSAAQPWWRALLASGSEAALRRALKALHPFSLVALLATGVGVLVEVPVMLSVFHVVLRTRDDMTGALRGGRPNRSRGCRRRLHAQATQDGPTVLTPPE
jgi:ACR3 family arsenite efflux pump ArsB